MKDNTLLYYMFYIEHMIKDTNKVKALFFKKRSIVRNRYTDDLIYVIPQPIMNAVVKDLQKRMHNDYQKINSLRKAKDFLRFYDDKTDHTMIIKIGKIIFSKLSTKVLNSINSLNMNTKEIINKLLISPKNKKNLIINE